MGCRTALLLGQLLFILLIAPPYDRPVWIIGVPDLATEEPYAVRVDNPAGEHDPVAVLAAKLLAVLHLHLSQLEDLNAHDGGVAVLHMVLRQLALVLFHLFGQEVRAEALLKLYPLLFLILPNRVEGEQ